MTGPKRVNFSGVGEPPAEWTAHLKWSAMVLRSAGGDVPDQELLAELEHEERERQLRRPIGRREVPPFRRHPDQDEPVLFSPDLSIPFRTKQGIDLQLGRVHVYGNGVSFQLIARVPDLHPDQRVPVGPETMNLSFRIKPGQPHRIRLVVAADPRRGQYGPFGGTVLSNSSNPRDFPEDPDTPWLVGGVDHRGRIGNGEIEFAATYFLSPVPAKGKIFFIISYPEFGIETTDIELDASMLSR